MPSARPLAIKMTGQQIDRFDRLAQNLSARAAGSRISRSEAIRVAADRGATLLESENVSGSRKKQRK